MSQSTKDILAGFSFLFFALIFGMQMENLEGVSRLFPQSLIVFLVIGSLYLLVKGVLTRKNSPKDNEQVSVTRITSISIMSITYVLLIPLLGFFPASALFLFLTAIVFREKERSLIANMLIAALFTAIFSFFVWLCFVKLLGVPIPEGVF